MKPRQIVTIPHRSDCDIREWVSPVCARLNRDRIGRKRRSVVNEFIVLCCNNSKCPALMIMPWHEVAEAIHLNEQKEVEKG